MGAAGSAEAAALPSCLGGAACPPPPPLAEADLAYIASHTALTREALQVAAADQE